MGPRRPSRLPSEPAPDTIAFWLFYHDFFLLKIILIPKKIINCIIIFTNYIKNKPRLFVLLISLNLRDHKQMNV